MDDVKAARVAKAEQQSELAEFDENIPLDREETEEASMVERELAVLANQVQLQFFESHVWYV